MSLSQITLQKKCTKCHIYKEVSFFYARKHSKYGVRADCMECNLLMHKLKYMNTSDTVKARSKQWRLINPQKAKESTTKWRCLNIQHVKNTISQWKIDNKDTQSVYNHQYYIDHKDQCREHNRNWKISNPHKVNADTTKRRLSKQNRTPIWLNTNHLLEIEQFYNFARKLSSKTDVVYHVDHIVPLHGKTVCGLHVPWNLQVISAVDNLKKGNKLIQ